MENEKIINTAYVYLHDTLGIKKCTYSGVAANVNRWRTQKQPLINTLRKHPEWSEEELAIVTEIEERQGLNRSYFDLCRRLYDAAACLERDNKSPWWKYEIVINNCFCDKISDNNAENINSVFPELKIYPNTRSSRVLHRFFQYIGYDKCSEYEKLFAQISDCISVKTLFRKAVLSVSPLDYLTMSNGNSWSNCLTLAPATNYDGFRYKGKHKAGTLSYMTDKVSCLFYTADKNCTPPLWAVPKITRQVIFYRSPLIVHGRIYPKCVGYSEEQTNPYMIYKNAVQKIFAECEGVDNEWGYNDTRIKRGPNSFVYPDWEYYPTIRCVNLSLPKKFDTISVGDRSYCIHCGKEKYKINDDSCATLLCADCEDMNNE